MKILIAAQYYRTGSTLIQRCLHACENTTIYGEMNGLLGVACSLSKMGTGHKQFATDEVKLKKRVNWVNKVDDDYSLCIPNDKLSGLAQTVLFYTLGIKPDSTENIGFKCISPSAEELDFAAKLGFKIIWVTRNIKDATNSYLSQPWNHGLDMLANAKRRSDTVTESFLEYLQDKDKIGAEVYKVDYTEIHEKIGGIIEAMGLSIEKEKLQAILANKVNSGY